MNKKTLIIIVIISIFITVFVYNRNYNNYNLVEENDDLLVDSTTEELKEISTFFVDVKGAVKKPGVYEFKQGDRVIDAINKAGGLKTTSDTSNINLSQKLKSEMVVYIYTKSEIKNNSKSISCDTICETNVIEVNNCIKNDKDENLININTANEEELLKLSGLGESKAKKIIEYREANGNFESIDEIKNVSGIGDALFENIKDKIKV